MLFLTETDILENQKQIKLACEAELFEDLDSAAELIEAIFPGMISPKNEQGDSNQKTSSSDIMLQPLEQYKHWISDVFEKAIDASGIQEFDEPLLEDLKLPEKMARKLIHGLLKILSCGSDLSDNGYMFLSDVANALNLAPSVTDTCIEQNQYEKRKKFTRLLQENLSMDQRFWVARMLWRAIHADRRVDTREYKYFENILHLLNFDQGKITQLEKEVEEFPPIPFPDFDPTFRVQVFQYVVEIVLIDGEYSPEEVSMIKSMGTVFGFDDDEQDNIIQPIASALMTRRSLF